MRLFTFKDNSKSHIKQVIPSIFTGAVLCSAGTSLSLSRLELKQQRGRYLTSNQRSHEITLLFILGLEEKAKCCGSVRGCSACSAKPMGEMGRASAGTKSNEEIKGVWRQKQEAVCHTTHPSMQALPPLPPSSPLSILYLYL